MSDHDKYGFSQVRFGKLDGRHILFYIRVGKRRARKAYSTAYDYNEDIIEKLTPVVFVFFAVGTAILKGPALVVSFFYHPLAVWIDEELLSVFRGFSLAAAILGFILFMLLLASSTNAKSDIRKWTLVAYLALFLLCAFRIYLFFVRSF